MWYPFYYTAPDWDKDTPKPLGLVTGLIMLVCIIPVCMVTHTILWFPIAFLIGQITSLSWWIGFGVFMLVIAAPVILSMKK